MTGWRIGYAAGPQELITAMKTIQSQSTSNPCSVSQAAAVAALNGDQSAVREMTAAYKQRHDYVVPALNDIDGFECRPAKALSMHFREFEAAMQRGLETDTNWSSCC